MNESIRYFEQALTLAQKNGYPNIIFEAVNNLGVSYCHSNNVSAALRQAEALSRLLENNNTINSFQKVAGILTMGEIYLVAKEYEKSEYYLLKGLSLAEKAGTGLNQLDAHQLLHDLYKERGMFKKALEHHERYAQLMDQLGGRDVSKYVNELEVKYRTAEKDKSIINKQLLIERQNNKINRATIINNIGIGICLVLFICFILLFRLFRNKSLLRNKKVEILEQAQKIARLKGIVQGEQNERLRVAGELHDGIGGILATLKMKFSHARKQFSSLAENKALAEVDDLIEHTAHEIRRASHNLMPDALTRYALKDALIMYRDDVCGGHENLFVELLFIGSETPAINNTLNLVIFRMVQEIILNILKHSEADEAVVQIIYLKNSIKIIAEDDGKGFDTSAEHHGIGLKTLHSRVDALSGHITINASLGKGTTIFIELDTHTLN